MRIEQDVKLDFKDVLIRPKRSTLKSRSEVTLKKTYTFRNCKKTWSGVPIMAANMDTTGTFTVAEVLSKNLMMTVIAKHNEPESFDAVTPEMAQYVSFSTGTSDKDFERLQKCVERRPDIPFICIDVANGYSEHFVEFVKKTRKRFPDHILIAGNVVTGEMVEELILSGADIVKVGIGPGSVCTTRKQTGVGYPQLSAVIECADSAHGLGGHIISDGGCTVPGDVAKAFGAGADFVMLGGMLAGHDECAGDVMEEDNGEKYKIFYGMSSETAMRKYSGGVAEYRSSEGKTVKIPYRGPLQETVKSILGGLRSSCTYVGAAQLKELPKRTTFIKVTQQINNIYSANEIKTPK
ncbi:GMP reductase [Anaeromyces robustus]|uniref:GMP reductase n=1 Tax=Anaeromyces robustus TaxID=1754192 RepID=A0A1Y1WX48_9FUNG|nr:GMP reductase [Anaeromyces robustus]|eukprot:ORX77908.1 GMP reductase [Anaeromyces robustus]